MKKKILSAFLVAVLVLSITGCSGSSGSSSGDPAPGASSSQPENSEPPAESTQENTPEPKPVKYHNNKTVNQLITDYNAIATTQITPEMVSDGAYDYVAQVSFGDVFVRLTATEKKTFVDYEIEAASDEALYVYFHDFCLALDPALTEDQINGGWAELQTGKYINYSPYDLDGIEVTYDARSLNNGGYRYTIKSGYAGYPAK